MKYSGYDWDLSPDKLIFDPELNLNKLDWKAGDHFKLMNIDGMLQLVKLDPIVIFTEGYTQND